MTVKEHNAIATLQLWARQERRPKVARRMQLVVLAQQGFISAEIARLMGESPRTVERWVARYNAEGVDGVADRARPGKPPILPRDQEAAFCQRLDAGPTESDAVSVFHGWNIQQILEQEFGALYSLEGVYALLHRLGYSWLCPRPEHEEADHEAQEAFKKT